MMGRKFNKEAAGYKFKLDVLALPINAGLSQTGKELLWKLFLYNMAKEKFITRYQSETWKYPELLKKK